tara:strand:- start:29 stop:355 length:327 start_codon:yes stop_codon:yes gene_type:complete
MNIKFTKKLSHIKYATKKQMIEEFWDIEGIIKNHSNQVFKFDIRPIKNNAKIGHFKTKADKMVFDIGGRYIIIDTKELNYYIKENKVKDVHLQYLISKLDWNIILSKK